MSLVFVTRHRCKAAVDALLAIVDLAQLGLQVWPLTVLTAGHTIVRSLVGWLRGRRWRALPPYIPEWSEA